MGRASQVARSIGTRPYGKEEPETLEGPNGGQRGRNTVRLSEQGEKYSRRRLLKKEDQTIWGLEEQGFSNFNGGDLVKMQIQTH